MTPRVELFCEDGAHESSARALVARSAVDVGVDVSIHAATASGGVGRLKRELRAFQATVARRAGAPDLLVVLVDANAVGPNARRREVEEAVDSSVFPRIVVGTPDPCIERWMLADPDSFRDTFGAQLHLAAIKSGADWKSCLVKSLEDAGEIVMQGGAEFAEEIFGPMDLYRASRNDPTIGAFTGSLRAELRQLKAIPSDRAT